MKIVVTGATGLIGRYLCKALLEKGYEVVATSRNAEKAKAMFSPQVTCASWDGKSAEQLAVIVKDAYAVVNLVGENIAGQRWTKEYVQRIINSRLDSGLAVKKAFNQLENPPQILIQASAIGYYGNDLNASFDESSACATNFLAKVCEDWENSIVGLPPGVRVVLARTGIVLANEGGAYPKLKMPIDFFVGATLGGGKQWFSWLHIDDEVDALIYLIENSNCKGIYNLNAPKPVTQKEALSSLAKILHRPLFLNIPAFLLKAGLGEMAVQTVLASQKVFPKRLIESGFQFKYPSIDLAFKALLKK